MRALLSAGLVFVLALGVTGCSNNQAKTEELTQQILDEMNKMADAIEKGDKPGREAAIAKMRQIAQSGKNVKITAEQNKAVEAKFKPKFDELQKRMETAMTNAIKNGKMTPDELLKFSEEMTKFGEEMKAMGK
jgi:DNA-binding GntR family transcriptional regulator